MIIRPTPHKCEIFGGLGLRWYKRTYLFRYAILAGGCTSPQSSFDHSRCFDDDTSADGAADLLEVLRNSPLEKLNFGACSQIPSAAWQKLRGASWTNLREAYFGLCLVLQTWLRCLASSLDAVFFPKASLRCLGSRLGDYARSEIEGDDPGDGRCMDEPWTGWSCRRGWSGGRAGAAEIAWEEARGGGARSKGMIRWTGGGRAGAAEIAWEDARDGGARSKGMIRWTGGGRAFRRAAAAEIALGTEERDRRGWCGGRAVDEPWTGWGCRNSMGGG